MGATSTATRAIVTGADYIESLRGRNLKVWFLGERVAEPVDHPVIRPSINAVARTYDLAVECPDLATAWESSSDARTFTFQLRRDARFSNGRAVTSDDFRYGIERVLDPATNSRGMEYYRGIVGSADFAAHRAAHVRGIETPDPFTVVFHLDSPDPIFVHKLTMPFASAVPREVAQRWGDDFSHHVVGSGAFMLQQWLGEERLVRVRNPY